MQITNDANERYVCVATDIEMRLLQNQKGRHENWLSCWIVPCDIRQCQVASILLYFFSMTTGSRWQVRHRTSIPQTKTAAAAVATQIRSAQHVQLKHTQHIANNSPQWIFNSNVNNISVFSLKASGTVEYSFSSGGMDAPYIAYTWHDNTTQTKWSIGTWTELNGWALYLCKQVRFDCCGEFLWCWQPS